MTGLAWKRLDAIKHAQGWAATWDGQVVTLSCPNLPGAPWSLQVSGLRVELVGALDLAAARRDAEVWLRQRQRDQLVWWRMMDKAAAAAREAT